MSIEDGWTMSRSEMIRRLRDAHRDRHNHSRARTRQALQNNREASSRGIGSPAEERRSAKSAAALARKRQQEDRAEERHRRRVGASIRKIERAQAHKQAMASSPLHKLFEFEPDHHRLKIRAQRDLYFEWIPRGIAKGQSRNYKSPRPRIAARMAKWQAREFQDKILYIERPEALEEVGGNLVSNMGFDQAERLGCAERIEQLEPLSRKNANVYTHVILALPAALSPSGRAALLGRLCKHLARLELPHAAALHKPDPGNSQDNYHAHILVSLRPMRRTDRDWQFAASKRTWLGTPAGLKLQRRVIAREFNRALDEERQSARWTHRSRADDDLAPGGFTKRGGRGFSASSAELRNAEAAAESALRFSVAAYEIDRTVDRLQQAAVKLSENDRRLGQIEVHLAAQQRHNPGASNTYSDIEAHPRSSNIADSQDAGVTGRPDYIANSQDDAMERDPFAASQSSEPEKAHSDEMVKTGDERPIDPDLALEEADRQQLKRKARLKLAETALAKALATASPKESHELETRLEDLERAFDQGLLVACRGDDELDIGRLDDSAKLLIEAMAMSETGYCLLRALASDDDRESLRETTDRVTLVDPAIDYKWTAQQAAYLGKGMSYD